MKLTHPFAFIISALLVFSTPVLANDTDALRQQAKAFFAPLPATMPSSKNDSAEKIALGQKLYFETALSVNGEQSCNSCHLLDGKGAGVDNKPTSPGALPGTLGDRNSPTVWNAGFQFAQFWDGRAADLKEQAKGPILNPVEMGMPSEQAAVDSLKKAGYSASFDKVFGKKGALTYDNIAEAIAAFERTLITQDRFDAFLNGDNDALSAKEQQGLKDFINTGCIACHTGPVLGGQSLQKMGLANAFESSDLGLQAETGKESDHHFFKVPMLRDVSNTAPYFHNGSVETLEEAVKLMAWHQLGKELDENTTDSIVTFLKALDNQKPFKM